jgi:uncharacterized repeat protein (TIGR01451 family)
MCKIKRMKMMSAIIIFAAVFTVNLVFAQSKDEAKLGLKTTAQKEVKIKQGGKTVTKRIPLDKAQPRDILVYTITYVNMGKTPIVDATIVDPIPTGTVYILDSAWGKDAEMTCSINGGQSFEKPPILLKFKKPDGTEERKPALADRYTHIRWMIKKPVLPGHSGRVFLKVTVK